MLALVFAWVRVAITVLKHHGQKQLGCRRLPFWSHFLFRKILECAWLCSGACLPAGMGHMEEGTPLWLFTAGQCLTIRLSHLWLPSVYYTTRSTFYPKVKTSSSLKGECQPWSLGESSACFMGTMWLILPQDISTTLLQSIIETNRLPSGVKVHTVDNLWDTGHDDVSVSTLFNWLTL